MATLRGIQQPELSKKLFKLIKSENHAISAIESSGRERIAIASLLSDWGEGTGDEAVSDVSDKLGVLMSELGEQEELLSQNLEDYRSVLKQIRNTEGSVQPSRDAKGKITDEIQKLKHKEPESTKIQQLEQELVRAEAQNLVAEAQLTNVVRNTLPSIRLKGAHRIPCFTPFLRICRGRCTIAHHFLCSLGDSCCCFGTVSLSSPT